MTHIRIRHQYHKDKYSDQILKNVAYSVLTRFFFNLALSPSCLTDMTNIQTWPTYHQDKHSDTVST